MANCVRRFIRRGEIQGIAGIAHPPLRLPRPIGLANTSSVPPHETTRNVRIRAPRRRVALSRLVQLTGALGMLSLTSIRVIADRPDRPAIAFNRWSEDWSVLADPDVPREALDELKYIPLSDDDARTYLSFGANIRERFEVNQTNFGTGADQRDWCFFSSKSDGSPYGSADGRAGSDILQVREATLRLEKNASRRLAEQGRVGGRDSRYLLGGILKRGVCHSNLIGYSQTEYCCPGFSDRRLLRLKLCPRCAGGVQPPAARGGTGIEPVAPAV